MPRFTTLKRVLLVAPLLLCATLACGVGNDDSDSPAVGTHAPVVSSFAPASGPVGTSVVITGSYFTGATQIRFGGTTATSMTVDADSQITATVPAGASSGVVSVTTAAGSDDSSTSFTVTPSIASPSIASFSPTSGPAGTSVVITGAHFTGATAVRFGDVDAPTLAVVTDSRITAVVPSGASSGTIAVDGAGGTGTSSASFTVTGGTSTLDLMLDGAYINQSVQTWSGDVPLIADRDGLLRVFVRANMANSEAPIVRVTLDGTSTDIPAPAGVTSSGVPLVINQGDQNLSWNLELSGSQIHSGMTLQIEVDPSHALSESNVANNLLSPAWAVQSVNVFRTTLVPVIQNSRTGNVDTGRTLSDWVDRFQRMYPVQNLSGGIDVQKRSSAFTTTATLVKEGDGWGTCLSELNQARVAEGSSRYYYGAVNVEYDSGVAGLGYVPGKTAIGWDKEAPSSPGSHYSDGGHFPEIFAHEVGHNLSRNHAPCGVLEPDSNWPTDMAHADALIGAWGWDHGYTAEFPDASTAFRDPATFKDIMSYCTPLWISDYTYKAVLTYRAQNSSYARVPASQDPVVFAKQECLMIAGRVKDGQVLLDSSFRVHAVPLAPEPGDYILQLHDASGKALLEQSFGTAEVADLPSGDEQHFAFTVPCSDELERSLVGLRVMHQGRVQAVRRSSFAEGAAVVVRDPVATRMAKGRSHLSWDPVVHPKVMVRDPRSGEVIAFAEGGYLDLPTDAPELEVTFSDGVRSQRRMLRVQE